ncbi:MAG: hypothetical protein WBV82_04060, partial [Myxococcaceae bacterium]
MPHALWAAVVLGIAAATPQATPAPEEERGKPTLKFELDLTIEPLVARNVVVVPIQASGAMPRAVHRRLVQALQKELGDSVIDAERIEAATKSFDPEALRTVPGMTALAQALGAARLLVFEPETSSVVVHVFNSEGLALRSVELKNVKRFKSAKEARRVAKLFGAQAEEALSDPPAPEPEPAPESLEFEPVPLVPLEPEGIDPSMDIALEVGRDQHKRKSAPGTSRPREFPVAQLGVGAAAGLRQLTASGNDASALLPLDGGALPSAAIHLIVQPLQLTSAFADASWSGFLLEGRFRRAFAHARRTSDDSLRCNVIDQDWMARVGWQSRPEKKSLPRLGGGAGFGSEEVRYGCELPTASSRYRYAEVHARVAQPFANDRLVFELVFAPRFVFEGPGVDSSAFSFAAEGWLTGHINRWSFVRAGARLIQTRVERAESLALV